MNFVSKAILIAGAGMSVILTTPSANAIEKTEQCPKKAIDTSWTDLDEAMGHCQSLPEASFQGVGRHTKNKYTLHLLSYLKRNDAFLGLTRNHKTGHTALGFPLAADDEFAALARHQHRANLDVEVHAGLLTPRVEP